MDQASMLDALRDVVEQVAAVRQLPSDRLNFKAMQLDILPYGWHIRCRHVAAFGSLSIFAVCRLDLLAMKFYANHAQDREDIQAMQPTREELDFVRTYLNMLRVPSRQANLDQVQWAVQLLETIQEKLNDRND